MAHDVSKNSEDDQFDQNLIEGQFCEVRFGTKWITAICVSLPFRQHDLFWAKVVLNTKDEDFVHMNGETLALPCSRVRVPDCYTVKGQEVEAILKQYCVVLNELTKDKELNSIEAELFKIRIGSFLDLYLNLYDLPSTSIFGGTPTLLKLIAYIIVLEKLEEKLKNDKRFVQSRKNEIGSVIDCALEVLKFYVCALCENQRENHPEPYEVENSYDYGGSLSSGVEKGLMGLEGPSSSVVRNTVRFFGHVKVYTLNELTSKLRKDLPTFTDDYFLNYPHDVILVPEDTNFLLRTIHNNPRTTFWTQAAAIGAAAVGTGGIVLPIIGGVALSTMIGTSISNYFGLSEHRRREAKELLREIKEAQEEEDELRHLEQQQLFGQF